MNNVRKIGVCTFSNTRSLWMLQRISCYIRRWAPLFETLNAAVDVLQSSSCQWLLRVTTRLRIGLWLWMWRQSDDSSSTSVLRGAVMCRLWCSGEIWHRAAVYEHDSSEEEVVFRSHIWVMMWHHCVKKPLYSESYWSKITWSIISSEVGFIDSGFQNVNMVRKLFTFTKRTRSSSCHHIYLKLKKYKVANRHKMSTTRVLRHFILLAMDRCES